MLLPDNLVDWTFYLLRVKWICLVLTLAVAANIIVSFMHCREWPLWRKALPSVLIVVASFVVLAMRSRDDVLLTLLGSEDDIRAEQAYAAYKMHISVPKLISIIRAGRESDNVQFYLCRMLASHVRTPYSHISTESLCMQLDGLPSINPTFIEPNIPNEGSDNISFPASPCEVVLYYLQRTNEPTSP